jgi:hypothetical protein
MIERRGAWHHVVQSTRSSSGGVACFARTTPYLADDRSGNLLLGDSSAGKLLACSAVSADHGHQQRSLLLGAELGVDRRFDRVDECNDHRTVAQTDALEVHDVAAAFEHGADLR